MNPKDTETYTTEVFYSDIPAGQSEFTEDIFLDFQPDDIILKTIAYSNSGTIGDPSLFYIRSNMFKSAVIASIPSVANYQETYNKVFKNDHMISGTYSFKLENTAGEAFVSDDVIYLAMTFTFVKWK
eukprot:Lithocolla_globosa_v1_NODE_8119_length_859_cov_306.317164.p1 type:complete len:127 gc:universal NODE_8119_length_859_cov_306.317164:448-68(-)